MPEGRVMNIGGTMKPEYIITDHQGNARVSFMDNGSGTAVVQQENSYYGFGMVMPGSLITGDNNRNLYNGGSEWQNDYSNLPDYYQTFYRNYDAALGRWIGTDPESEAAESMSVYQYSNNNPVMYNDPLGDVSDAQWLMAVVSYNNGPILDSYHADSGSNDVSSLNDGSAFQAGATYADKFNMFGSGNGVAANYVAAVGKYNSSLLPGQSSITTTEPVHVVTATTWYNDPNSSDISGTTTAVTLDHYYDINGRSGSANQDGPHFNLGLNTDPSSFNLKKIGNSYETEVTYHDIWHSRLWGGHAWEVTLNFNLSVNIKGRLTPDGNIQILNKLAAQSALAATFDHARKLTYDEWQQGDINPLNLMDKFLSNLNWSLVRSPFLSPAYAQPVKPGGWNGVPTSVIRYNGLFIFW